MTSEYKSPPRVSVLVPVPVPTHNTPHINIKHQSIKHTHAAISYQLSTIIPKGQQGALKKK
jgi:hypothetical protein